MGVIRRTYVERPRLLDKVSTGDVVAKNPFDEVFSLPSLLSYAQKRGIQIEPLDLNAVAKELSVKIEYINFENSEISGKLYNKEGKWIIEVNKKHAQVRQRFTIAHELAHLVLHRNMNSSFEDAIFFRSDDNNAKERQANLFASELLLPKKIFFEKIKSFDGDIQKIAEYFKVSTMVVRLRAQQLDLKGHGL